jgi:hypothetical protein
MLGELPDALGAAREALPLPGHRARRSTLHTSDVEDVEKVFSKKMNGDDRKQTSQNALYCTISGAGHAH